MPLSSGQGSDEAISLIFKMLLQQQQEQRERQLQQQNERAKQQRQQQQQQFHQMFHPGVAKSHENDFAGDDTILSSSVRRLFDCAKQHGGILGPMPPAPGAQFRPNTGPPFHTRTPFYPQNAQMMFPGPRAYPAFQSTAAGADINTRNATDYFSASTFHPRPPMMAGRARRPHPPLSVGIPVDVFQQPGGSPPGYPLHFARPSRPAAYHQIQPKPSGDSATRFPAVGSSKSGGPVKSNADVTLSITLPITIPSGVLRVTKTSGENFYSFPAGSPAGMIFSPDDGVCDTWASFLEIRLAQIYSCKAADVPALVRLFHAVFDSLCLHKHKSATTVNLSESETPSKLTTAISDEGEEGEVSSDPSAKSCIIDKPINFVCKGIVRVQEKKLATYASPASELDKSRLNAVMERLHIFKAFLNDIRLKDSASETAVQPADNNTAEKTGKTDPTEKLSSSVMNELLRALKAADALVADDVDAAEQLRTSGINFVFTNNVDLEKDALLLHVNEYGDVENLTVEEQLKNYPEKFSVKDVEVGEIRLAYLSRKMIDPRFLGDLVLTRQVVSDETMGKRDSLEARRNNAATLNFNETPASTAELLQWVKTPAAAPTKAEQAALGRIVLSPNAVMPKVEITHDEDAPHSKHGYIYRRYLISLRKRKDGATASSVPV